MSATDWRHKRPEQKAALLKRAKEYIGTVKRAYPGIYIDAALLAVLTAIFALHYFHSSFIFQGDVFLNLYIRTHHSLFALGFDPYAWGYLGWYPIYGALFPLNIVGHFIIGLFGDSPEAALKLTQFNAAISLFALAFFSYLLFRFLKRERGGALIGAIIISFTGFHIQAGLRELDTFYLHSFMFVPLTLILLIKANRESSIYPAILAGFMVGLSLLGGGNSPMFLFIPIFIFAYAADGTLKRLFSPGAFIKSSFFTGLAFCVAMLIGAAMVLPSLKYMELSSRASFINDEIISGFSLTYSLLTALYREWWNLGIYNHEADSFIGLPILILALLGLKETGRKTQGYWLMVVTGIFALLSMHILLMPEMLQSLFKFYFSKLSLRFPYRYFMVLLLVVAFFSARGFDLLMERGKERLKSPWKDLFFLASGIAVALFIYIGIVYYIDNITVPERMNSFIAAMVVTALFYLTLLIVYCGARSHRGISKYGGWALIALIFIFYYSTQPDYPVRTQSHNGYPRLYPATVKESIDHFFHNPAKEWQKIAQNEKGPFRVFDKGLELRKNLWAPRTAVDVACEPLDDPATAGSLYKYCESIFHPNFNPYSPLLDLYNVKYLKYRRLEEEAVYINQKRQYKIKEVSSGPIYNRDAFDRFFVTHSAKFFAYEELVFEGLKYASKKDLRQRVFLVSSDGTTRESAPYQGAYEEVDIIKREPGTIELSVTMNSPGYLVSSELWFPAWSATVDGEKVDILKAYGTFRAVELTKGPHEVIYSFRDNYALFGKVISLLSIAGVLCVFVMKRKKV